MKYLQLACLMLIFGTNIWSQETIRFFKQDFDVSKYQNEEIDFYLKCKTGNNTELIVRAFFDSKKGKYLGYQTLKSSIEETDGLWSIYKGKFKIPVKADNLDMGILTSSFPESINLSELRIFSNGKNIYSTNFKVLDENADIYNYKVSEENKDDIEGLKLTIDKNVLYGNNLRTGNTIELNGVRFYYEIYGKGEPVLLLHGNKLFSISDRLFKGKI